MIVFLLLAAASPCAGKGTRLLVDSAAHRLYACHGDKAELDLPVALGAGGTGKTAEGDLKTPTGEYPLGPSKASRDFHRFIPLGYPTPAQQEAGYTGGAVGLHGPKRIMVKLGQASVAVDWTRGCIALASDRAIDRVDAWVERRHAQLIEIR